MNKIVSISLIALVSASCNNSGSRKIAEPVPAAPTSITTPSVQLPGSNNAGTTINMPAATVAPEGTASVTINPQHGAPGHRCDLPVGAPLTGQASIAPAAAPNKNAAPIMLTPPPTTSQPANNSSVRLNPAHGAPGHDCSIPVGQPLKS